MAIKYTSLNLGHAENLIIADAAPAPTDVGYPVGTLWINDGVSPYETYVCTKNTAPAQWSSGGANTGSTVYKGVINVPGDFPTLADVKTGWWYLVGAPVTDNDPTKTNTGQSFIAGVEIYWNGAAWAEFGENRLWSDDGANLSPVAPRGVKTDVVGERTAGAGVTVDGLLIKDNRVPIYDVLLSTKTLALYVDKNRTDTYTECGSETFPYKTIGAAVAAAVAMASAAYVTIRISGGVYAENVVIENLALRYLILEGYGGYVAINPAAGNALQSISNNANLKALYCRNIVFARPVVLTGGAGDASFEDVIWDGVSFVGACSVTVTCVNSFSLRNAYSEVPIAYHNVNWSYIESSQLQGTFTFAMDSAQPLPSWGKDGNLLANGVVQSGAVSYTIGGTATYTPGLYSCRWGSSVPAVTVPAGVTIYAYNSWLRPTITNNGSIHLRNSTMQGYVAGTGTLNIDNQPASQFKNDSAAPGDSVKDVLDALLQGGTTGSRPVSPVLYQLFFDTTLGKPIWWDGANWVDATGATV